MKIKVFYLTFLTLFLQSFSLEWIESKLCEYCLATNKPEEVIKVYEKFFEKNPNNIRGNQILCGLYLSSFDSNRAITACENLLKINPDHCGILGVYANLLRLNGLIEEAFVIYEKLFRLEPNNLSFQYNYAFILTEVHRYNEAIALLKDLLSKNHEHIDAHYLLAATCLRLGEFKMGWDEYEWRYHMDGNKPRIFEQPVWDGSSLKGKTILVHGEQGMGDIFQFVRYLKEVKQMGGTVIFQVTKPLIKICSLLPYVDKVVTQNENLPNFDFQIALMSLPRVLGIMPSEAPYLYIDQKLIDYWHSKLQNDKNFKIGICWHAGARYIPKYQRIGMLKSVPLIKFVNALNIKGISLYSLQKINGLEVLQSLPKNCPIYTLPNLDEEHGAFMDTAAVMKNLDLVITVDTSIAHLAGGLGVPVWVMLPYNGCWRWLIDRNDSPWYPTMRLFRQSKTGDWESIFVQVAKALREKLGEM